MTLSSQQFDRTRRLASSLAGIELVDRHRELLAHRSRRLGILESAQLDFLLDAAEDGESSATQKLLRLLTTKFTGFFRHPRHFEIAARHALRKAQQEGRANLWSSAAATGEEPWSLAMTLIETFQCDDPPAIILATDVDVEALAMAERGEYGAAAVQALTPARRERFLTGTGDDARWSIAPAVRGLVGFRALNLAAETWPIQGPFDVIFCRNALMYLEAGHRYAVLERLASLLAPDGLLMLDPTEHPGPAGRWFTPGADGVYSLRHEFGRAGQQPAMPVRMPS